MSPKRRDVIDRLRRRFDVYRRRHNGFQQRYDFGQRSIYEQERQHALVLRQKWLESKAKKASKSKSKSDNSGSDHRNQNVAVSLHFLCANNENCVHCRVVNTHRMPGLIDLRMVVGRSDFCFRPIRLPPLLTAYFNNRQRCVTKFNMIRYTGRRKFVESIQLIGLKTCSILVVTL